MSTHVFNVKFEVYRTNLDESFHMVFNNILSLSLTFRLSKSLLNIRAESNSMSLVALYCGLCIIEAYCVLLLGIPCPLDTAFMTVSQYYLPSVLSNDTIEVSVLSNVSFI